MKKIVLLSILACLCICCSKNANINNDISESKEINVSDTMFVAYSVGAYAKDRLEILYPKNAYVTFEPAENDDISITVLYSWGNTASHGFKAEIPSIGKLDMSSDFRFTKEGVAAKCKTWSGMWEKESEDITLDINCSFKKDSGENALSLVITPSDNMYFPIIKISKVSNQKVDYGRGGDIVEVEDIESYVFHNELDTSVSISFISYQVDVELDAHKSKTIESEAFPGYFNENESDAVLSIDEAEYTVHLCSTGIYTSDTSKECTLAGGELYVYNSTVRDFIITPELHESLREQ